MRRILMISILGALVALSACAKEEAAQPAQQAGPTPGAQAQGTPTPGAQAQGTPTPGAQAQGAQAQGAQPAAAASPTEEAKNLFQMRCAICHGQTGKGDGPGAASIEPKPRNYSDKAWQASVTDEDLKKVIVGGGVAVGKSPLMPPNPDLGQKPEVLDGVVALIRSFAEQ